MNEQYVEPSWLVKMRKLAITLLLGFALGSIMTNYTYTYQLMKDCELMKQFRINNLAYDCKVK